MFKKYACLLLLTNVFDFYINADFDWSRVEEKTQKAVVQVWNYGIDFNWTTPFAAPKPSGGVGSGFFINETDLLTNYHVVQGHKSLYITMPFIGQRPLQVNVIGVSPEIDVALLRLTEESYNHIIEKCSEVSWLPLGNSDNLFKPESILAVGFPLGFTSSKSTLGNLAGREFLDGSSYMHITSPINPGNSGGPSLNKNGEVIGINSAGIPGASNVGYIIPINHVKILLKDLYNIKFYRKPVLGLRFNPGTKEHASELNNPVPCGAYIYNVEKDSIADKVGIKVGDMLYEIRTANHVYTLDEYGDLKVGWSSEKISVPELFVRFKLGKKFKLFVYRNGERIEYDCTFDICPKHSIRRVYPDLEPEEFDYEMFGGACFMQLRYNHFEVLPQNLSLIALANSDNQDKEVIVLTSLLPGSLMHKVKCFYPGCLIKSINNKNLKTLSDLREALRLSSNNGKISITTMDNVSTVLSLEDVLEDEPRIARDFVFSVSSVVKDIYEEVMKKN